jgi:EAL domain-containing protein (putative c-di-GMP-specific phosphodiesterase class I)
VLLEGVKDQDDVVAIAERIAGLLGTPISLRGHEIFVRASIGIALCGGAGDDADGLLRKADLAMYRSKTGGKARLTVYDQSMNAAALERLQLESDLHLAIERGELRLVYQPIVPLDGGGIAELEALLRWEHPRLGLVSPAQFIPIAEENGLIVPIGRWVIEQACRQLTSWQLEYGCRAPRTISVNLSVKQLNDAALVGEVEQILRTSGLDPRCLKVEITESTLMADVATTAVKLRELKALGVKLAIDDFGTGYSSLSYLKQLPLDTLKIDRSFVHGLGTDPQDTVIVRTVIALAKSLGLAVTGEGIETVGQLAQLQSLGCDRGQGYHFSKPLTATALAELLVAETRYLTEPVNPAA